MDEQEAGYLSWFYSTKLDSEWEMKLTDKQKEKVKKVLKGRKPEELISLTELQDRLFGKDT